MNVGIYVYDGAEVLDFSGPFEVFATANRVHEAPAPFQVFLIGERGDAVTARGGYRVLPHYAIDDHPPLDLVIIAGGVYAEEMAKVRVLEWIRAQRRAASCVALVCTGVFLLARADETLAATVTTHHEDRDDLRRLFGHLRVVEDVRWIDEGAVVTSGGISAGLDMSLHLVARFTSEALAQRTAAQMEYTWVQ